MKPYDLKYRPLTYWPGPWMDDVVRTKGSFEKWIGEGMAPESRPNWGGSPASLEAGSYLPDLEDGECEIARVEVASTLGDVFSVRARAVGTVIHFRVVDEYETGYGLEEESEVPLSFAELVSLIDSVELDECYTGLVDGVRNMNLETTEPEELRELVRVTSAFYPGLTSYYEGRADEWIADVLADRR